jgi:hypothetical protein
MVFRKLPGRFSENLDSAIHFPVIGVRRGVIVPTRFAVGILFHQILQERSALRGLCILQITIGQFDAVVGIVRFNPYR